MNSYHTLSRPFFFSYMRYSVRHASSLNLLVVSSSAMACCRTQYPRSEQGRRLSHTLLFYLVEVQSSTPNGKGATIAPRVERHEASALDDTVGPQSAHRVLKDAVQRDDHVLWDP